MCHGNETKPTNSNPPQAQAQAQAHPVTNATPVPPPRDPRLQRWPEDVEAETPMLVYLVNPCKFLKAKWDIWTFAYMNVVLAKGAQQNGKGGGDGDGDGGGGQQHHHQPLTSDDLYDIPEAMQSQALVNVFQRHHPTLTKSKLSTKDHDDNDNDNDDDDDDYHHGTNKKAFKASRRNLFWALWKIGAPTFVPAGFCELLVVFCGTGLPLLVKELLQVLEDNPGQQDIVEARGLPLGVAIFAVSVLNAFGNHRHRHLALKTGVALRAAVVNILYQHVLQLSPQGRQGLTSGEVTNLVAVDTQKLFEVTQEGHLIWALPLSIVLVSIFLYRTLGPSTLVGIVVLVLFVPIIQKVTARMLAIRQERVKYTDQRVELVSNMLQGIKVTKLNNYESSYLNNVTAVRDQELHFLSREMAVWASTLLMTVVSPVLATAATFTTYVLMDETNILTASDTFGVLLLFSALRFPINFAGRLIGRAAQALSAIRRITLFLDRPLRVSGDSDNISDTNSPPSTMATDRLSNDDDTLDLSTEQQQDLEKSLPPLTLTKASFRIGGVATTTTKKNENGAKGKDTSTGFTVSEFDLSIAKGQVLAVCGPVGSGKSTLLAGLLDEAEALGDTTISIQGSTSYVPQTPFILNQTIRENILFGRPYDPDRYDQVLEACALKQDLDQLGESGDLTEIGERGVTLSGGQKQRISLARAAYAPSDLYILDDPFSALDSGTGKIVFERLIASPEALLKDAAMLLVTHASHFITHRAVDQILLMVDGQNRFLGSWDELACFHPTDGTTLRAVDHIKTSIREDTEESDDDDDKGEKDDKAEDGKPTKKRGRLIQVEQREHGLSSLKTWLLWFQRAGGWKFMSLQVLFMVIDRFVYVAVEWFLAEWTAAADGPIEILGFKFPAQTDGISAQAKYLRVYATLIVVSFIATAARSEWAVTGGGRATRNVFASMLDSVLKAPMSYFETVPMGRILNRFTYDTDINDVTLTQAMSMFMISCSWYVAGVTIQCTILPWSALAVFPVSGIYWYLMLHYRMSGPDLQRLDALSRSPLQSMVNECLEGSTSIRVFHQDSNFVDRFRSIADVNSSALLNFVSAQRWLGARMELLGSIVVLVSSVLVVYMNESLALEPGLVGLLIMWSSNFTITLNFLVDTFSETEAAITAIERVEAMADLPSEKPMKTDPEHEPPTSWPERGLLKFDKVSLRYRDGLPLALNELSFEIPAGKTCGIVGRTGAGKSSITVALFRLVEIEAGRILLDGVDLGILGLSDVRGRGMSIIPQDPFLAGATLRECLDPFGQHSDAAIVEALYAVRLGSSSGIDDATLLSTKLEEGGSNYSVGERQLLNLARALLSQPKLLVLDEATASIDGETDAFIQKMLRTRFPNTTLVTIAHRLNTIMDYDHVLVMDAGRAVEFGSPAELLELSGGVFSELVDATGAESSKALRDMANEARK